MTEALLGPRPSVADAQAAVKALNALDKELKTAKPEEVVGLLDKAVQGATVDEES